MKDIKGLFEVNKGNVSDNNVVSQLLLQFPKSSFFGSLVIVLSSSSKIFWKIWHSMLGSSIHLLAAFLDAVDLWCFPILLGSDDFSDVCFCDLFEVDLKAICCLWNVDTSPQKTIIILCGWQPGCAPSVTLTYLLFLICNLSIVGCQCEVLVGTCIFSFFVIW